MKYYSSLTRKEILTQATTWMNPEHSMLSQIRQTPKDTYSMIPLTCGTYSSQVDGDRK